jgi:hypothetical protein
MNWKKQDELQSYQPPTDNDFIFISFCQSRQKPYIGIFCVDARIEWYLNKLSK